MPPTVSVVIPTYKAAPWLEKTLQSVLDQSYPREQIELIVVDDKSPDNTVEIATNFLQGHSLNHRIVAREKNAGVTVSRNIGWRMATGEWLQFLDHDDLLEPHKLDLQTEYAARLPDDVAVIYSAWQHLELIGEEWQPNGPVNQSSVDDDSIVRMLQDTKFGYVGPTLIRKSFLEKVGGFIEQPNISEDLDLMLRLAMAGGQFRGARSERPGLLYRQSPNSLWRYYIKNPLAMKNRLGTFRGVEEFLRRQSPTGNLSSAARNALALRYTADADFYLEHDPESFHQIEGWLHGLGLTQPPNLTPKMRACARMVGYGNSLRLRSYYQRLRKRLRGQSHGT
jgi:glycosyltransferase involved in cell wall biosynthesis